MEYLVTSQEMRFCDNNTSGRFHIPPAVLMERAALACFSVIEERQAKIRAACAPFGQPGFHKWLNPCLYFILQIFVRSFNLFSSQKVLFMVLRIC